MKAKKYAKELLGKLTLTEKVAQLSQTVAGYRCYDRKGEEFFFNDELKIFSAREKFEVEPGKVSIYIGAAPDFALQAEIETE